MRTLKTLTMVVVLPMVMVGTVLGNTSEAVPDYRDLQYPELPEIDVPQVERVTLPNGMKLLVLEDHELPLIRLSARIRTGSVYEPADKVGLADITGEVMRTGGTKTMPGDQIDEALEAMAASVETGIGTTYGWASLSVLKEDVDETLAILADILMHPAFPPDKIMLSKIQHRSAIARRNDSPGQIASREYNKLIYGPESPYAQYPEYATIDAIAREDLVAFHEKYFGPDNMIVAVWGDFETDEMVERIEKAFDGWEPVELALPPWPDVDYEFRKSINLVTRPDLNQSTIFLGHVGGVRNDPDYFTIVVMNQILGGGFTGRLFRNVRSRHGLAYSVFGSYGTDYSHRDTFHVGCQTKSGSTVRAIRAMIEEIGKLRQEEVTDEELQLAKESFLNSFVFNFDSEGEIVTRLLTYEYYGYPADFLQKTRENVENVTKAEILRVAQERLHPDKVQVLVVGNPDQFDRSLSELGEVNRVDITIPPPQQ